MRIIPAILDRCVEKLKAQGKSEKSAFAICTTSLKKSGKLDEVLIDELAEVKEGTFEFEEFETYLQENALLAWSVPSKRKNLPASHFFDHETKKYPYRNQDGSINSAGVRAAEKLVFGDGNEDKVDLKVRSKIQLYKKRCFEQDNKTSLKEPFRRFSSPISESFLNSIQFSEKETNVDIQCLRMGKFKHPWYGTLKFDQPFFDNLIKNFEADIPNPEIAFDFRHMPDYGAAAWINKLFVEDENLMASVTLTEKGRESIEKKEFRYFSIEYTDDYIEYEFIEEADPKGNIVDKETKVFHGPTVLGGGLTNRPFIKGMAPVSLNDAGEMIQLEEVKDGNFLQSTKEVKESMEKSLEELKTEQDEIKAAIKELEEKKDDSSKEELQNLASKLNEISAAVKELSEEGENKETSKNLEEAEAMKIELEEAKTKLGERDKEVSKLSDNVETLSKTVTKLMESSKILQEDKHRLSVEKQLETLRKLSFPATMKVIEKFAFSEDAKTFSVTLSEGEGENKKDVQKSFLDVVGSILESIPEEHRFSETELSESITTPTGKAKEASIEDVEKYAEEKKITFEEALVEFSREGKIE